MINSTRKKVAIFLAAVFLLGLSACSGYTSETPTPTPQGLVPVSSDLRDFYQSLGGEKELGPAISTPFLQDGVLCQFTTNVLLCYNAAAQSEADRSYLAPIGKMLNLQTSAGDQDTPAVYEGFASYYHQHFFGLRYVGKPLTGIRYNPQSNRLEQYFEKMGFYILLDDPQPTVHLLAYGLYTCGDQCAHVGAPENAIIGWNKGIEVLNPDSLARLGDYAVFGTPLTRPYLASDGNLEQALEKVVVYVPKNNPTTVRLRTLAVTLNLPYNDPAPQRFGPKDNMVFYPVDGKLGYHVPIVFDQFIATHGGVEISGKPLSDPYQVDFNGQAIARQCFEKYCLDYFPDTTPTQQVKLVSLGQAYLDKQQRVDAQVFSFSRKSVYLTASEDKPQISKQESQIIRIVLRTRQGRQPISDIEAFVMLGLPDGTKLTYNLPPTDKDGLAKVAIPPLSITENGVIIPYIVCLNVPAQEQICANESFLVWNTR